MPRYNTLENFWELIDKSAGKMLAGIGLAVSKVKKVTDSIILLEKMFALIGWPFILPMGLVLPPFAIPAIIQHVVILSICGLEQMD